MGDSWDLGLLWKQTEGGQPGSKKRQTAIADLEEDLRVYERKIHWGLSYLLIYHLVPSCKNSVKHL